MPNKQSFYESIKHDTIFDIDFFRKVLGYSMYDKPFLGAVAEKLAGMGRTDVVKAYNNWYSAWKTEDNQLMKKVAELYQKENDREFKKEQKVQQRKAVNEWELRMMESLHQKSDKELLILLQMVNEESYILQ